MRSVSLLPFPSTLSPLAPSSALTRQGTTTTTTQQQHHQEARGGEHTVSAATMGDSAVEGAPITTSAVLMSASKHISSKCGAQNRAFLDCKRNDPNPDKCLDQGQNVTRCVISLLRELNTKCPKAMESYTKCMDYYSNEFELCRKEQREFEASCPL